MMSDSYISCQVAFVTKGVGATNKCHRHTPPVSDFLHLSAGEMISGTGFHVLELSAFDACTNTEAETTVSKCFDAISQQSVKQKTFVAFYAPRGKQCQHKRTRGSVDGSRGSLLSLSIPPVCVCVYLCVCVCRRLRA